MRPDELMHVELIRFVGLDEKDPNVIVQAKTALVTAEGLINAYCRGRHKRAGRYRAGVEEVLTTVAARILANPGQIQTREQVGPYSMLKGVGFSSFTLVELAVLNRYRKRAL